MKTLLISMMFIFTITPFVADAGPRRAHYQVPQCKKNCNCEKCKIRLSPPGCRFCYQDYRDEEGHWAGQRDSAYDRIFRNGGAAYRN